MAERVSYTILYDIGHHHVQVDKYYMVFWMKILGLYNYDLDNASDKKNFSNQSMTFNQFIQFINSNYHAQDELTSLQVKQLKELWYKNAGSSSISKWEFINSLDAFRGFFNKLVYEKIIPLEDLTFIVDTLRKQFREKYKKEVSNIEAKKSVQKDRDGPTPLLSEYDTAEPTFEGGKIRRKRNRKTIKKRNRKTIKKRNRKTRHKVM